MSSSQVIIMYYDRVRSCIIIIYYHHILFYIIIMGHHHSLSSQNTIIYDIHTKPSLASLAGVIANLILSLTWGWQRKVLGREKTTHA